jgi:hypothetical protein
MNSTNLSEDEQQVYNLANEISTYLFHHKAELNHSASALVVVLNSVGKQMDIPLEDFWMHVTRHGLQMGFGIFEDEGKNGQH